ncbi:hypothetical protein AgCh_036293 [Apium graveolens]
MKMRIEDDTISGVTQAANGNIHKLDMEDELAGFSSCSSSSISLGGRAIDRCNPIIRDAARLGKVVQLTTASTRPPTSPQPTTISKHHNKNIAENMTDIHQTKKTTTAIKSCLKKGNNITIAANDAQKIVNKTCSKAVAGSEEISVNSTSPGDSSRYLLTTSSINHMSSFLYSRRFDPLLTMVEQSPSTSSSPSQPTFSPPSPAASDNQVVVLRVSLHCKGCERKMRKHISKMKGVRSFNIDFAAKKLTVVGDVTPLSVLASVSKVKKAQLLTPPLVSSSPIPSCSKLSASFSKDKAILV